MINKLRVPFSFSGLVEIECSEEEYESSDASILHERAKEELEYIELLGELDFDGFDFTSTEWIDEEE